MPERRRPPGAGLTAATWAGGVFAWALASLALLIPNPTALVLAFVSVLAGMIGLAAIARTLVQLVRPTGSNPAAVPIRALLLGLAVVGTIGSQSAHLYVRHHFLQAWKAEKSSAAAAIRHE